MSIEHRLRDQNNEGKDAGISERKPGGKAEDIPTLSNKNAENAAENDIKRRKVETEMKTATNFQMPVRPRKPFSTFLKKAVLFILLTLVTLSILLRIFRVSMRLFGVEF